MTKEFKRLKINAIASDSVKWWVKVDLCFIMFCNFNTYTKVYVLNIIKEVIVCIAKIKM